MVAELNFYNLGRGWTKVFAKKHCLTRQFLMDNSKKLSGSFLQWPNTAAAIRSTLTDT